MNKFRHKIYSNYIKIKFLPHRKHAAHPLQRTAGTEGKPRN
jgi:hypothetical protein